MKIVVGGSRDFCDYKVLREFLDIVLDGADLSDVTILSGGCRGADMLAEQYAEERGIWVERHPAEWDKYGRAAGVHRNCEMVDEADKVVAFWDEKSRGTKSLIEYAKKCGKILEVKMI